MGGSNGKIFYSYYLSWIFFPLNFETLAWWKQNIHTYIFIVCEERDAYINCTGVTFFFCLKNMPEFWECSCGGGAHVHSLSTKASDRQSHRTASRGSHGRHNGRRPPPSDPCRLIKDDQIRPKCHVMIFPVQTAKIFVRKLRLRQLGFFFVLSCLLFAQIKNLIFDMKLPRHAPLSYSGMGPTRRPCPEGSQLRPDNLRGSKWWWAPPRREMPSRKEDLLAHTSSSGLRAKS